MLISGTLKKNTFWFYEMWVPFIIYWFYSGVFCFLNWKQFVLCYYGFVAVYIYLVNLYYSDVPVLLYISMGYSCILYPVFCLFISNKLKEMIALLKINKDLIHTIQNILQVFPEGVIIRSLDERSKELIMKFANNIASKTLEKEQQADQENNKISIQMLKSEHIANQEDYSFTCINDFLNYQEKQIGLENSEFVEQLIKIKDKIDHLQENFIRNDNDKKLDNETIFSVKSIKVNWNNNNESFMHVFINTTQVK